MDPNPRAVLLLQPEQQYAWTIVFRLSDWKQKKGGNRNNNNNRNSNVSRCKSWNDKETTGFGVLLQQNLLSVILFWLAQEEFWWRSWWRSQQKSPLNYFYEPLVQFSFTLFCEQRPFSIFALFEERHTEQIQFYAKFTLTLTMFALHLFHTFGMQKAVPRDSLQVELFVAQVVLSTEKINKDDT